MKNIWLAVDLLLRNPHWWSPFISSTYGASLESRIFDRILYVVDKSDMPLQLLLCLIILLINMDNYRPLPPFRQFLPIRYRKQLCISERNDLLTAVNNFDGNWSIPCDLCYFNISITIWNLKAVGYGTSVSAVCTSLYLKSLTPWTFYCWEKCFKLLAKI
jgi:hypothetical protein